MKKSTKRVLGGLALAAGAVGAAGALVVRKKKVNPGNRKAADHPGNKWARAGMTVTFRAELMPGRDRDERSARVKELLSSGRVTLHEHGGEHAEREFESVDRQ